jgi:hypothetical protein
MDYDFKKFFDKFCSSELSSYEGSKNDFFKNFKKIFFDFLASFYHFLKIYKC